MPSTPKTEYLQPTSEYMYNVKYTRRDGSSYFYMSDDTPPYEETWSDNQYLHIFWSYGYTAKKIFRAYFPKR